MQNFNYINPLYNMDLHNTFQYIVKKGDSLYDIAKTYNTTVDELIAINRLPSTMIYPNQVLFIPKSNTAVNTKPESSTYLTKNGDSIGFILKKYNLSLSQFEQMNDIEKLQLVGNQLVKVSTTSPRYYVIESGDTIETILKKNNLTPLEFINLNKNHWLKENAKIIVG